MSESDSDSSVASILGVSRCLDGIDGDAWISGAEGAQDDIQVSGTSGVNDPGDIPWRTTQPRSNQALGCKSLDLLVTQPWGLRALARQWRREFTTILTEKSFSRR